MINYPANYDDETTLLIAQDYVDIAHAEYYNNLREAALIIENILGLTPQCTQGTITELIDLITKHIASAHAPIDATPLNVFEAHVNNPIHHNRGHRFDSISDHTGTLNGAKIKNSSISVDKVDSSTFEFLEAGNASSLNGIESDNFALTSHTHDGQYLKLSGGTISGTLTIRGVSGSPITVPKDSPVCLNLNADRVGGKAIDELLLTEIPGHIITNAGCPLTINPSLVTDTVLDCRNNQESIFLVTKDLTQFNKKLQCDLLESTINIGEPFQVNSQTQVNNLNVEYINGKAVRLDDFAILNPGYIFPNYASYPINLVGTTMGFLYRDYYSFPTNVPQNAVVEIEESSGYEHSVKYTFRIYNYNYKWEFLAGRVDADIIDFSTSPEITITVQYVGSYKSNVVLFKSIKV